MKDLKAVRASQLLHKLVEAGEHDMQDFKYTVNDPRKIARSVSAFANNKGGHLLIGVDDNGRIRGVRSEEDIYVVEAAASIYCVPECKLDFTAFKEKGGAIVIRATIEPSRCRPIYVREEDNKLRAYFRVADENINAHPLMLRIWKVKDDATRSIVYEMDDAHTAVLNALTAAPQTTDNLYRLLTLSKRKVDDTIVSLALMDMVEFAYINRAFHLKLKEEV